MECATLFNFSNGSFATPKVAAKLTVSEQRTDMGNGALCE